MEEKTGFMDKLAKLVTDFDMDKLMPELDSVLGWVEFLTRLAVLIGPVLLAVLGALYYFRPPAEANHTHGYRFYWGMGSVEAWRFTQRLAGICWMALGLVLTVIMLVLSLGYRGMTALDMVTSAFISLLVQFFLIGLLCLAIDTVVVLRYDKNGCIRKNTPIKVEDNFLELVWFRQKLGKRNGAPAPAEPVYAEPAPAEPVYAEPVYAEPMYAEPVYTEPAYAEPVYAAPVEVPPAEPEIAPPPADPAFAAPAADDLLPPEQ